MKSPGMLRVAMQVAPMCPFRISELSQAFFARRRGQPRAAHPPDHRGGPSRISCTATPLVSDVIQTSKAIEVVLACRRLYERRVATALRQCMVLQDDARQLEGSLQQALCRRRQASRILARLVDDKPRGT